MDRKRIGIFTICFIASLFSLHGEGVSQHRSHVEVVFEGEYERESISAVVRDGVVYVSLQELGELLHLRTFYSPKNKKMVLRVGSRAVKVTAMNPFVMVDTDVRQMALSTKVVDGRIYAPLALFLDAVGPYLPGEFSFHQASRELRIRRVLYNITGVEVEEKLNGILVRFVTTKDFQTADIATSINRKWLNVTLYGGTLDTLQIALEGGSGIVEKIMPFQFEKSAQVSLLLKRDVVDPRVYIDKGEVVISMRSSGTFDTSMIASSDAERRRWLIDRIIIDPGHGGKDPGCVGRSGVKEKDINLDIAKRLKRLLEQRLKVDVLMTREEDKFVGLKERTQFANTNEGKLFISIHCNANESSRVRGFATYILGTEKSEEALAVAEKENSVIEFEEDVEVYKEYQEAAHILNAIAQNTHLKESEDLARMMCESVTKHTTLPKLGKGIYHHHLFYGLVGAAMPKVLVESAFISNSVDERYLRVRANRQKIAEALYESIKRFKKEYEKEIGSS